MFQQYLKSAKKEPSAIDRFFWSRGVKLMGYNNLGWALGGYITGGIHAVLGIIFTSLISVGFPALVGPVFLSFGIILCIATFFFLKQRKEKLAPEVKLSAQARKLLSRIGQHIGWYDQTQNSYNQGTQLWALIAGTKTASNVMNSPGAELLEAGCFEFNRLTGLLKLGKENQGKSHNMAPAIQAATDEAIISLLNQVALLEENPETRGAIWSQAHGQIARLKELADRYEQTMTQPETIADRLSSTTIMDSVLDQLRYDSQAREELKNFNSTEH
jgi:hypothetical protein